ncbi:Serine/threonine-protein kinase KIN82 [Porphyridium purpureum]|uniref:non-specific serine/threonine protein kinase n=1 Tax=Porphyridium purpureum TaxID=35688 RepID=A0A5J4YPQ0_PORPP|nr:Serine/threonine-protein kinase KIN82 [Porphyridium purpureum]|eukprot:POR9706..scf295_9
MATVQQKPGMPRPQVRSVNLNLASAERFDAGSTNSPRSPGGSKLAMFTSLRMERQSSGAKGSPGSSAEGSPLSKHRLNSRGTSRLAASPLLKVSPINSVGSVSESDSAPGATQLSDTAPLARKANVLSDSAVYYAETTSSVSGSKLSEEDATQTTRGMDTVSSLSSAVSSGSSDGHSENGSIQKYGSTDAQPYSNRMRANMPLSDRQAAISPTAGDTPSSGTRFASERRSSFVEAKTSVGCGSAFPLHVDEVCADRFIKIRRLGRGAVGTVYLVKIRDDPRPEPTLYAMKVIRKEEMVQKNKVHRVMTERNLLATTSHPYLVGMYASFQTTSKLYYCMDAMLGGELYNLLKKMPQNRLPEAAVRQFIAEILLALEYLHHQGFIYRDLKPENILLDSEGHLALADFDLSTQATHVQAKVTTKRLSLTDRLKGSLALKKSNSKLDMLNLVSSEPTLGGEHKSFVGTEEYLAPEVVSGDAQTPAVDWWTLGILMHEMLYGCTPFRGEKQDETFQNILNKELKFPSDVEVSKECKDLMKRLLTRQAAKRIGFAYGADEIKSHKWFDGLNFALLRNMPAPISLNVLPVENLDSYTTSLADMEEQGSESSSISFALAQPVDDGTFSGFDTFRGSRQ